MRTANRWSTAVVAALALLVVTPATAQADTLPFNDTNAHGSIGLCDATGTPIRSGSVSDHPFVAMAAASVPAPDGFTAANRAKATLYAFQPRKDVDPGEWSGMQMTGSSIYADSNHPMVAGTNLDASVKDFVSDYPARWDGFVELRIYYSAPNRVPYNSTYPAAVLRVSGDSWTVVQGADVSCDSKKVISNERLLLPASAFNKKTGSSTPGSTTGGARTAGASAGARATTPPTTGAASPSANTSSVSTSASARASAQSSPVIAWLVAGAAVLAAASGGWLWWRRRSA